MKRCGNCGAMMDDDSLFCPECGMKQEEQPPYGQEQPPYGQEDWKPYKKKGGGVVVVCVFLLISLLIVGGIGFGIYRLIHPAREIVAEYDYDSGRIAVHQSRHTRRKKKRLKMPGNPGLQWLGG